MTERFYIGSQVDCSLVAEALNVAQGCPFPPASGPLAVTAQRRAEMTAQWFQLSREQRDSKSFDTLWPGWTLRAVDLVREWVPGIRVALWVPDIDTQLALAVANGRVLSLAQTTALLAAKVASLVGKPGDWTEEPEPE